MESHIHKEIKHAMQWQTVGDATLICGYDTSRNVLPGHIQRVLQTIKNTGKIHK